MHAQQLQPAAPDSAWRRRLSSPCSCARSLRLPWAMDRSDYLPAARLIAAVAAAWLGAVTVIAALTYLVFLIAMTVEKRLGNLEDDLDDVDLLIAKYHNTSCGSFDRLTNASCAQIAQYDAVTGVASAASTLDAALNATDLGVDVARTSK
mgnify:CR=1 FL=1